MEEVVEQEIVELETIQCLDERVEEKKSVVDDGITFDVFICVFSYFLCI